MKREQRRRRRRILRIVTTLILMLLTAVVIVTVLRIRALNAFKGDYYYTVDLSDRAVGNIALWLADVEGAEIDPEWIKDKLPEDMSVKVALSFERRGFKRGSYEESLDEATYTACEKGAYDALSECLKELIIGRLVDIGYAESVSGEEADTLIKETLGMTMDNYLKNAGVLVLPSYDELAEPVNRSGDFKIKGKTITWERDGAEVTERFVADKETLSFPESGESGYLFKREAAEGKKKDSGKDAAEDNEDDSGESTEEGTGGVIDVAE
ncbi:MAG: hypothetical protein K6E63_07425 [Lachnospiraceae bacterium]|nr:hypothetical protein [Lachnospiraceae bacterium]